MRWMQAKPLANRTIAGILQVCRNANPSNRQLFTYRLTLKQRSVQSDVLSVEEIGMVLKDMKEQEQWFYPLFLLWLSTGLGCVPWSGVNAEACDLIGDQ